MSFNRSGYIGRAPGDSSIVLAKQYFQPTGAGKTFTFTAGYDPGLIDVYRNGVKLINVLDYAATDGSTIILDTPVGVGSTVQVVAYKGFNLAEVNSSGADFNVGTNLYVQSGFGSFAQGINANEINVTGIGTIGIGSFVDVNISGAATVAGTLVANSFSGDGSALTGLANTAYIVSVATTTGNLNVSAAATITGDLTVSDSIAVTKDLDVGAATTISGILKCTSTTPSTSTSTGGLVVSGGLGVGADVYIGAGLSVAGTLTYEDVTSVDSVGMVTAKSGVNVSGGQLQVGVAYSVGSAGVATALGFVAGTSGLSGTLQTAAQANVTSLGTLTGLTVNGATSVAGGGELKVGSGITVASTSGIATFADGSTSTNGLHFGSGGDLKIFHDGTHSKIDHTSASGSLFVAGDSIYLSNSGMSEYYLAAAENGAVSLYYDNSGKLSTTTAGVTVTGTVSDSKGDVRKIIQNSTTGSYSLVAADAGKHVLATGTVTIPNSTFAAGDAVTIVNNSGSDITLTASVGTLYNTADAATGNRTLAGRGMATILFSSATVAYISGAGLS